MSDSKSQHKESKNIRYVEYVDVFSQPNVVPTACVKNHLILFDSFSGNNPFNEIFYEIPNKMYQNLYIYITKGEMTISINNQDTELKSGDSIIIMPENIIRIKNMSTGIKYFMFVIYPKLASEIFNDIGLTYSSARLSLHHFTAQLDNEQMQRVLNIYDEIRHDLITFDYEYKALYIRSMLDILLVENINTHKIEAMPLEGDSNSRQYDVYCKFIALLNKHAVEQRSVQYYANTLGISSKYLSYVCISYSNKNASTWIDEAVIQKAKALILVHHYTLSETSEILHFSSISSFSRFFTRVMGMTHKNFVKSQTASALHQNLK